MLQELLHKEVVSVRRRADCVAQIKATARRPKTDYRIVRNRIAAERGDTHKTLFELHKHRFTLSHSVWSGLKDEYVSTPMLTFLWDILKCISCLDVLLSIFLTVSSANAFDCTADRHI